MMPAAYLESHANGSLAQKVGEALSRLKSCNLCPRLCGVDRTAGETGFCRTGRHAVVASHGPHFGEERPLVGRRGSGAIFFSHCNLYCAFCQNVDISHGGEGVPVGPEELAGIMIALQERGCHNINLVTPSHVIAQILEALPLAVEAGLTVPLVFNTGGYDRASSLRLLDGVVDIYMPDFKFWDAAVAERLCSAEDYPERARASIRESHRQVGDLVLDDRGIAERGLLVRHLVMPDGLAGSREVLRFIAGEISANTYVNVMDQYHPCGDAVGKPSLGRRVTPKEFADALRAAEDAGLSRLDDRHRQWVTIEMVTRS